MMGLNINSLETNPSPIGINGNGKCLANISEFNPNDYIASVTFTLIDPNNNKVFENTPGNSLGNNIWESTQFNANSDGVWQCIVKVTDDKGVSVIQNKNFIPGDKLGLVSVNAGDKPFFTLDSNPQSCDLKKDESCVINWRVIPTGPLATTWKFFSYFNSESLYYLNYIGQKIYLTIISGNGLLVNLESPINNYATTNKNIQFNCSAVNLSSSVSKLALYNDINGWKEVYSVTNKNSLSYTVNNIPEGNYKWNCYAQSSSGNSTWAIMNYTFSVSNYANEDVNQDGNINLLDLILVAKSIGTTGCSQPGWCARADVSRDGKVDIVDLIRVAQKV